MGYFDIIKISMAKGICQCVHYGQVDKGGAMYIKHPHHLAESFGADKPDHMIVSFLHDTVEDHPDKISVECIRSIFGGTVADAIEAISKRKNETYKEYIARVKQNELATDVKIADLRHNMRVDRLPDGGKGYESLIKRFADALKYLME